jgi:acyl-CoA thioesterase
MRVAPHMLNGLGRAHGGMIFTLADTAFAYACNARNVAAVALTVSITFIDGVREGERLVAEAREKVVRGRTGIYGITVTGDGGRIVAEMQGVCRILGEPVLTED